MFEKTLLPRSSADLAGLGITYRALRTVPYPLLRANYISFSGGRVALKTAETTADASEHTESLFIPVDEEDVRTVIVSVRASSSFEVTVANGCGHPTDLLREPMKSCWAPSPGAQADPSRQEIASHLRRGAWTIGYRPGRSIRTVGAPDIGEETRKEYSPEAARNMQAHGLFEVGPPRALPDTLQVEVASRGEATLEVSYLHFEEDPNAPDPTEPIGDPQSPPAEGKDGLFPLPTGPETKEPTAAMRGADSLPYSSGQWRPGGVYRFQVGDFEGAGLRGHVRLQLHSPSEVPLLGADSKEDLPDRFFDDLNTLFLLFMAYAHLRPPGERVSGGLDQFFRIPDEEIEAILGLSDKWRWSEKEKARYIYNLNRFLRSIDVSTSGLHRTSAYDGDGEESLHTSGEALLNTRLEGVDAKKHLRPGSETDEDQDFRYALLGREGQWANPILHDEEVWTPFLRAPLKELSELDGRNPNSRKLNIALLMALRTNKGSFSTEAGTLLEDWLNLRHEDRTEEQHNRDRRSLISALEDIDGKGVEVDLSEVRNREGASYDHWKKATVHFQPTERLAEANRDVYLPEEEGTEDSSSKEVSPSGRQVSEETETADSGGSPARRGNGRVSDGSTGPSPQSRSKDLEDSEGWNPERVSALRSELGESQKTFGDRLGVSQALISQIENGQRDLREEEVDLLEDIEEEYLTAPLK